jgi:hypothetical protein
LLICKTSGNDEMMMELLMQDEVDTANYQEQHMMVLTALLCYREKLVVVPPEEVRGLRRRRTRINIDLQVIFCLTQTILWKMQ